MHSVDSRLEVFGNVMKHCLVYIHVPSQSKLVLRSKRRYKIVKIYAMLRSDIQTTVTVMISFFCKNNLMNY